MPLLSLAQRSANLEHLDNPTNSALELAALHRQLQRLNKLFQFARPFQLFLPSLAGEERCRHLEILDVGAGTGHLGRELTAWAAGRGWTWHVTSVDVNERGLDLGDGRRVVCSALSLPFASGCFDCVIASQMTHHLATDSDVIAHFAEAWRVSRHAVLFSDLYRHPAVYLMVWSAALLAGCSRQIRDDGATSVARGFRVPEWEALARKAGIDAPRTSIYCGARILLQARKVSVEDRR
jgi:2-polyprenyl-3-methyl-5-hydroxy-6-metoxy-1,4-benzoquinol methylase